jgi:hypothetical protein
MLQHMQAEIRVSMVTGTLNAEKVPGVDRTGHRRGSAVVDADAFATNCRGAGALEAA